MVRPLQARRRGAFLFNRQIDNGSTDDYAETLTPYIAAGEVTLWVDPTKHAQVALYNTYMLPHLHETQWLIVCDLDEFFYGRNTIAAEVNAYTTTIPNLGGIYASWKIFGSSGFISQPASVIASFTKRAETIIPGHGNKCIVKSAAVLSIGIHGCLLKPGYQFIHDAGMRAPIQLNHYIIQSLEWFQNVKMTRGDVTGSKHNKTRSLEYFAKHDKNEIDDMELSSKYFKLYNPFF